MSGSRVFTVLSRTRGCRQESQVQCTNAMLASERMRECASVVSGVTLCLPSSSVFDLTCSVYHIPPRRTCSGGPSTCGNAACAAAISSIDDAALDKMKTGFTVSPGPRGACW